MAVSSLGRSGCPTQEVVRTDANPQALLEEKLVQVVGDFCAALTRENEHAIVDDSCREVAASGGAVSSLDDHLPLRLSAGEIDAPHVIESSVTVVTSKDPQSVVVDDSTVGRASGWQRANDPVLPIDPLAGLELVLKEVVLVTEVGVGVDVARVATEYKHAVTKHNRGMVVAGSWGRAWKGKETRGKLEGEENTHSDS